MLRRFGPLPVLIVVASIASAVRGGTMEVAKQVAASEFAGCKYGDHDTDATKVNCVQFNIAVLQKLASQVSANLTLAMKKKIAINNIAAADLRKAVDEN